MAGRPRTFDERATLQRAMEVFWSQGYEATSVGDLLRRMTISTQSMYNSFGDKEALFVQTLELYTNTVAAPLFAILNAPGADHTSIRKYFDKLLKEDFVSGNVRKGCLVVNSMIELPGNELAIRLSLDKFVAGLESAFLNAVNGARNRGQLRANLSPADAVSFLTSTVFGLMVTSKNGASNKQLQSIAQQALRSIAKP